MEAAKKATKKATKTKAAAKKTSVRAQKTSRQNKATLASTKNKADKLLTAGEAFISQAATTSKTLATNAYKTAKKKSEEGVKLMKKNPQKTALIGVGAGLLAAATAYSKFATKSNKGISLDEARESLSKILSKASQKSHDLAKTAENFLNK